MKVDKSQVTLYAVTDSKHLKMPLLEAIEQAILGGATIIQLREKEMSDEDMIALAKEILPITKKYQVPLIINDRVNVMKAADADGVHVGQDTDAKKAREEIGEDKILGVTAHNLKEALKAKEDGADYLGVGAINVSSTKLDTIPLSKKELKAITSHLDIPIVAIGGINLSNLNQLKYSNIDGVAVVSAIFSQTEIIKATQILKKEVLHMLSNQLHTALTIAGSDCSGGAGIQADIKSMMANGVYAMSAITALTAQNTTGVSAIYDVTPEFLRAQLVAIFEDIYPDSIKIGMVSQSELIHTIVDVLKEYQAKNIVVDPVMVATSGAKLIADEAIETLKEELLKIADVITPNIPEAEILSGMPITDENTMIEAAKYISETYQVSVLLKGGHSINDANDLLYENGGYTWFKGKRINNPNTHGTGCTLSSAIASNLAKGYSKSEAVKRAKDYISGALSAMLDLGKGSGPMNHGFDNTSDFTK